MILIFAAQSSERLHYILKYLFKDVCSLSYTLTHEASYFDQYNGIKINYSTCNRLGSVNVYPNGLLFDRDVCEQQITVDQWKDLPVFFQSPGDIPFDIFAASFFLVSRYEEYLPHKKDEYNRFDHQESLAFQKGFLQMPLVELWMKAFCESAEIQWAPTFKYLPSFDIDQAWSWRNKGWKRNIGGLVNDLFQGKFSEIVHRIQVLCNKRIDPFDAFSWMHAFHQRHQIKPIFFFLLGGENNRYDKQILPEVKEMKAIVQEHHQWYETGIHPSWAAHLSEKKMTEEIAVFEQITCSFPVRSRYHYIAFSLPEGYARLIRQGIKEDYSMGYGSINGFRASTSIPFKWFDLSQNSETDLLVCPFCWMDANSYYEQKQSSEQTLEELRVFKLMLQQTGGQMLVIWHNNFLGTDPSFKGWRAVYEQFSQDMI